jgi:hypothetical protein
LGCTLACQPAPRRAGAGRRFRYGKRAVPAPRVLGPEQHGARCRSRRRHALHRRRLHAAGPGHGLRRADRCPHRGAGGGLPPRSSATWRVCSPMVRAAGSSAATSRRLAPCRAPTLAHVLADGLVSSGTEPAWTRAGTSRASALTLYVGRPLRADLGGLVATDQRSRRSTSPPAPPRGTPARSVRFTHWPASRLHPLWQGARFANIGPARSWPHRGARATTGLP